MGQLCSFPLLYSIPKGFLSHFLRLFRGKLRNAMARDVMDWDAGAEPERGYRLLVVRLLAGVSN